MCGRVQPEQKTAEIVPSRKGHRLTQEERNELIRDIQSGLESGKLNAHELSRKYNVDHKAVAYWKKKLETRTESKEVLEEKQN